MTDTKECPNCGKWMIVDFDSDRTSIPSFKYWRCSCGHSEDYYRNSSEEEYENSWVKAWQEANKGEK